MLRTCRLDHLCVCVCVRKVYCGKTADWLRMPFGVMSGVGFSMGVLDGGGNCRRGRGSFVGEFGAFHCNQWDLCEALLSNYFEELLVYASPPMQSVLYRCGQLLSVLSSLLSVNASSVVYHKRATGVISGVLIRNVDHIDYAMLW